MKNEKKHCKSLNNKQQTKQKTKEKLFKNLFIIIKKKCQKNDVRKTYLEVKYR